MQTQQRKRILILTYYWPPSGGSGVQRWLKFAKYLPEFGWDPVVVAPKEADYVVSDASLLDDVPDALEVLRLPIREPYAAYRKLTGAKTANPVSGDSDAETPNLLKRLSYWIRANWFIPDPKIWWVKPTVRALESYLQEQPVDAIVSTGPPHSVHLIAQRLSEAFPAIPWILDVRDPWSQFDVHLAFGPGKRARRKNAAFERQALERADIVLGTAYSMPSHLEPFDHNKYVTITNGYDAADFAHLGEGRDEVPSSPSKTKFHVYHTGLLSDSRNPVTLWRAFADLVRQDPGFAERLQIHLIGTVAHQVVASLETLPELRGKYTVTTWMPHAELIKHYASADCFLLLPNRTDNARGQINGKLFEYLAMQRPILHIGPYDADNTRLLDDTHSGLTVPTGDLHGMKDALRKIAAGTFSANPHALQPERTSKFERRQLTQNLAKLLDTVAQRSA